MVYVTLKIKANQIDNGGILKYLLAMGGWFWKCITAQALSFQTNIYCMYVDSSGILFWPQAILLTPQLTFQCGKEKQPVPWIFHITTYTTCAQTFAPKYTPSYAHAPISEYVEYMRTHKNGLKGYHWAHEVTRGEIDGCNTKGDKLQGRGPQTNCKNRKREESTPLPLSFVFLSWILIHFHLGTQELESQRRTKASVK